MEFKEVKIYDNKTMADVFREIYINQAEVSLQAKEVVEELREKVESISDATILAPIIKDYLDTTIKNNDTLIKMMSIVEKSIKSSSNNDDFVDEEFTEEELIAIQQEIDNAKGDTSA